MIESVLRQSVKQLVVIVFAPGNRFAQARIAEFLDGTNQLVGCGENTILKRLPSGRARIDDHGPVLLGKKIGQWHSLEGIGRRPFPGLNVQKLLPNGMRDRNWTGNRLLSGNSAEQFTDGRARARRSR
jgi:hypothetical protein